MSDPDEGNEGLTTSTDGGSGSDRPGSASEGDEAAPLPAGERVEAYVRRIGQEPEAVWVRALGLRGIAMGRPDLSGNYTVTCPAHDDRVESLRWSVTPDGRVLVKCQASCETTEVVAALELQMYQLSPMSTEYHWCGVEEEGRADAIVAAHVREYRLTEGAKFIWKHYVGKDAWEPGRGEYELEPLWRGPELRAWAAAGGAELWLTEGEKDAYFAQLQFEADKAAKKPVAGAEGRIATTAGGGANEDVERIANAVAELCVGRVVRVVVVGDNDPAGRRRVARIVGAVGPSLIAGGSSVEILYPPERARDLAQAVDFYGLKWRERMVVGEVTDEDLEAEDPYGEFSVQTGMLVTTVPPDSTHAVLCHVTRGRAKAKEGGGEPLDAMAGFTLVPVLAVAPEVVGVEVDPEGTHAAWSVEWAEVETGELRTFRIEAAAIASAQSWAGKVAVPTGGALQLLGGRNGGVPSISTWLRHHSGRLTPTMVRPVCGWNQQDREWHFAGYEGAVIGTGQAIRADRTRELWRYGLGAPEGEESGESVAARQVAELVWFRRPEESCVLLAALAANTVRPVTDAVAGMLRVVSVHGLSNTGKTTYLRLALRAFGSLGYGQSNTTVAAFGRDVATGTGPYWLDDEAGPAMEEILSAIRGAATGGGRVRAKADTDSATIEQKSEALIVISAEAESRGEEKAMRDRMVSVEFTERAQDRMSRKDPSRPQWDDMLKLGAGDLYDHEILTDYAGWVVRGLWKASRGVAWDDRVGAPTGAREARVGRFLRVGAVVLADWLRVWGYDEEADLIEATVAREAAEREALSRELAYAGLDTYAATELLPRALASASATKAFTVTKAEWQKVLEDEVSPSTLLGRACQEGFDARTVGGTEVVRTKAPPVIRIVASGLVNPEEAETLMVAVRGRELYLWATSDEGRRAGVSDDVRNVAKNAIENQISALCVADEDGKPVRYVARYKGGMAEYRVLTKHARTVVAGG